MDEFVYHIVSGAFTILGSLFTVLWGFHKWDKKIEIRHASNKASLENMEGALHNVENTLVENTTVTNQIGSEIGEHIAEDRVFHGEFKNSLGELRSDIRDLRIDNRNNDRDARNRS